MAPKRSNDEAQDSARSRKKQKTNDARIIHFQSGSTTGTGVITNSMIGLPGAIDVEKFAEARSFEIAAMHSAMESAQGSSTQRAWQALPRSLRRRAASHDVRRVPVRLREKARAEMDSPSRKAMGKNKHKRGKSKFVARTQSFLKRQRDKTWLETHIWHAKRMHMKNVWGYRLSETPTEKSYRSSHRSSVRSSIIHDASYISTISVSGKQHILEDMLRRCCDCQGAGPAAVRYTLGSRIHETHMYKPGVYPFGLIAPVTIIWKSLAAVTDVVEPSNESNEMIESNASTLKNRRRGKGKKKEHTVSQAVAKPDPCSLRTFWIRVHPSAWDEVWLAVQEAASITLESIGRKHGPAADRANHAESTVDDNIVTQGPEEEEDSIDIADLRSQVNCFELMGPLSSQVLAGAMTLVGGDQRALFREFWSQLKNISTSGSVPRGMIIGLKVHDPRLNFPPKNAKSMTPRDGARLSTTLPPAFTIFPNAILAKSELWDVVERAGGAPRPKFQKRDLDDRRKKNLIPGTALKPLHQDDRIPIMLIQRTVGPPAPLADSVSQDPKTQSIHGWTILLPSYWSMPFFTSLVHTGTRVGGLRERRTQVFEAGSPDFPFDYPSTPAYGREETLSEKMEKERWEKKPPAKRVAWENVATRSPWKADWEAILGFLQKESAEEGLLDVQRIPSDSTIALVGDSNCDLWLLRGPDTPSILEAASIAVDPASALLEKVNALRLRRGLEALQAESEELLKRALVPVKLHICGRGAPDDLAAIYEIEPDEAGKLRELLDKKRMGDLEGDANSELSKLGPGDSSIVGYVTTGNLSLSRGKGYAIGAVSAVRLVAIMAADKSSHITSYPRLVKLKDRDSIVCRAASIEILAT